MLVYGDTNSTLAGALAAAQARIPVAHVEAGMRSFDRAMPEELNRVLTDHASDLLLCPSQTAVDNLRREGVAGEVVLVGDVMVDIAHLFQPRAREETPAFEPAVRAGDRAPRGQRRRPGSGSRRSSSCCSRCPRTWSCRCTRARARGSRPPGCSERLAAGVELLAPQGYLDFTVAAGRTPARS